MKKSISYKWLDLEKTTLDQFTYLISTEHILEEYTYEIISPHQSLIVPKDFIGGVFGKLYQCYTGFGFVLSYPLVQKLIKNDYRVEPDSSLTKEILLYSNGVHNCFRVELTKELTEDMYLTSIRGLFYGHRKFTSPFEIIQYKGEEIRIPISLLCAVFKIILKGLYKPKKGEFILGLSLTIEMYSKEFPNMFSDDFLKSFANMLKKEGDLKKILFVWDKLIEV